MSASNATISKNSTSNSSAAGAFIDKLGSPAKTIPLLLGISSLLALFVGFGMQYFLIGSGRSRQQTIDPLMKNSASTIVAIAAISVIGISLYYVLQNIERPFFWLFVLVMVQLVFLHIALSASLYQVEIVSE
jgi:hypothetical protein